MRVSISRLLTAALPCALAICLGSAAPAGADETGALNREAAKHFQRAVTLYGEADYRAALVEFRRAYELAPNVAVLYNIGETEFQLQDYASALTAFQEYVVAVPAGDIHRAEVERNIDTLRSRVGAITVMTLPAGADVAIDDQPIGRTPFSRAVQVSIGHRKVTVSMPGRPPTTRYVDVAADDHESITIPLASPIEATAGASTLLKGDATGGGKKSSIGPALRTTGWIGTGLLAAAAGTSGVLALLAEKTLENAKDSYPATANALNSDANRVHGLSLVADACAAGAVVLGGITLYSTLASREGGAKEQGVHPEVSVTPTSIRAGFSF